MILSCGGHGLRLVEASDGFRSYDFATRMKRVHIRTIRVFIITLIGLLFPMRIVAPSLQDFTSSARYQCTPRLTNSFIYTAFHT